MTRKNPLHVLHHILQEAEAELRSTMDALLYMAGHVGTIEENGLYSAAVNYTDALRQKMRAGKAYWDAYYDEQATKTAIPAKTVVVVQDALWDQSQDSPKKKRRRRRKR